MLYASWVIAVLIVTTLVWMAMNPEINCGCFDGEDCSARGH